MPRDGARRRQDSLAKLGAAAADVWVASAAGGPAHLVPLSLAWTDSRVVLAVQSSSLTARNVIASGVARLGLGPTRDVVMIDAVLERAVPLDSSPDAQTLADAYAAQADWDPRDAPGPYVYLVLRPDRLQAWREADELPGRTLMRAGQWLDPHA